MAITIAVIAAALAAAMGMGVSNAYAGSGYDFKEISSGKTGITYDPNESDFYNRYTCFAKKKLSNVKSSNTKVLGIDNQTSKSVTLIAKKAGKAKLTFKLGGKKKSTTIVVKKYKNPLKSFKVGGQECAKQYKKGSSVVSVGRQSVSLQIVCRKREI